jgi:hypothetical protein
MHKPQVAVVIVGMLGLAGCGTIASNNTNLEETLPYLSFASTMKPEALRDCVIQVNPSDPSWRQTQFKDTLRVSYMAGLGHNIQSWIAIIEPTSNGSKLTLYMLAESNWMRNNAWEHSGSDSAKNYIEPCRDVAK